MSTLNKWWSELYPAQYYAYPNTSYIIGGYPSVGWIDVSIFSNAPPGLPPAADMIALTPTEWAERKLVNQIVVDGKVSTYTPFSSTIRTGSDRPVYARATVYNNYDILNEATPDEWVVYIKALMAITNGKDTTSTALPTQSTDK